MWHSLGRVWVEKVLNWAESQQGDKSTALTQGREATHSHYLTLTLGLMSRGETRLWNRWGSNSLVSVCYCSSTILGKNDGIFQKAIQEFARPWQPGVAGLWVSDIWKSSQIEGQESRARPQRDCFTKHRQDIVWRPDPVLGWPYSPGFCLWWGRVHAIWQWEKQRKIYVYFFRASPRPA